MTTPETSDTQVFRPSPAARQRTILYGLIPVIPLTVVVTLNALAQTSAAPAYLALFLVAAVLIGIYLLWYLRATRIEFGGGRYRYVTAMLRREFAVGDVDRVVAVDDLHYGLNGSRVLFVVGRTRRRLLRLNSIAWDTPQLEALIDDLLGRGVPLTHIGGRITPGEFHRREPGLLWWHEAHRVAFVLLVVLGSVAIIVVFLIVLFAVVLAR